MANTAERVYELIRETVEQTGVTLWDVRFLKEGSTWYLRVFIDKADGVSIDDCTAVSHAIDPLIDEADPIDTAYYLEVCSAGLEREITRSEHYTRLLGETIRIKLYRAVDGIKEFTGVLKSADEKIVINTEKGAFSFDKKNISKANLFFDN